MNGSLKDVKVEVISMGLLNIIDVHIALIQHIGSPIINKPQVVPLADQFVYAPIGSVVGAYIPKSTNLQVAKMGVVGIFDGNETTTYANL